MKYLKRKKSQRSNPKNCFPEEAPKYMSLYESFDFLKEVSGLLKLDFTLTEFGGTFFAGFSWCLFFLDQGENYTGIKLAKTQSVKIQLKSRETPVDKNVGKMKQNLDTRGLLTPKSAKLTCYSILKIH